LRVLESTSLVLWFSFPGAAKETRDRFGEGREVEMEMEGRRHERGGGCAVCDISLCVCCGDEWGEGDVRWRGRSEESEYQVERRGEEK